MAWYNPKDWFKKANPAQERMSQDESTSHSTAAITNFTAFKTIEVVNRGCNLIVSAASSLDFDIKDKLHTGVVEETIRKNQLNILLNHKPNPYQSVQEFRSSLYLDFLLEGNIFIYWDGKFLYHLPASNVKIESHPKTFISKYVYSDTTDFLPKDIIHVKDLSADSIYRGDSRLSSALKNIDILKKMQEFQSQFFENGAISSFVLTTDNTLSKVAKDRTIALWQQQYNYKAGGRKPMIIDSGLKPQKLFEGDFKELDFDISIARHDNKILKALGIPPILLDSGNNANIAPNQKLFYLETVLPIVHKLNSAFERFFGYDIDPITGTVTALQPQLSELGNYQTTLVNGGILTVNEARENLRYEKDKDAESDKLRIPQNIAGSAVNPSTGGAPKKPDNRSN